jgi:hypothetical protein
LLLLSEPPPKESVTPRVIGISPMLACVQQPARIQFWKDHHIDLDELERESARLYIGLEQFEEILPKSDFIARANAYTEKLIAHHQQIKQVGQLLGEAVGGALVTYAESAIEWLVKRRSQIAES